jgi:high-affinity iron transporter
VTGGSAVALALLAFATVGREAVETVIFLLAIAFRNSPQEMLIGAVIGLAIALAASFAIYRLGLRINLKRFFTVVGAALMIVAAGLLANAVENLQQLQVLPGGQGLWNTGNLVPEDSALGDILHGLIGYAASPTALQVAAWALFLVVGMIAFFGPPSGLLSRSSQTVTEQK